MQLARTRRSRLLTVLVGLAVVIAIIVVDSVTISSRRHTESVRAAARRAEKARLAYVAAVRSPLTDVFRQAQPLQDVLDARAGGGAGIDFPARDAMAHTTAATGLRNDVTAIRALKVPSDLTAPAAAVATAVAAISKDVSSFAGESGTEGDALAADFETGVFATFQDDEGTLQSAVAGLYDPLHQAEPPIPGSSGGQNKIALAASHDAFLFNVDRACLAGQIALPDITKNPSNTQIQNYDAALGSILTTFVASTKKVSAASTDTVAKRITGSLPEISKQAGLFSAAAAAGRSGDIDQANRDVDQAVALFADTNALGKLMGTYGAQNCATFFSDGSSSGSGGTTSA